MAPFEADTPMPRQPKPALGTGLVCFAVCLTMAISLAPGESSAVEAQTPTKTSEHGDVHAAKSPIESVKEFIESHEVAHEPDILEPQPSLAIWTVVVFLGLLFVLGKFAWKPLLHSLHQREEHLEHVLLETERARNEGEQLLLEHRRRLAAAEEQVKALIDDARKNAQIAADDIVKKAQSEAEQSKSRAERDIATARDQALSEIWSKTANLSVSVAGRVLGKQLSDDDHRRLIDSAIAELPSVSGSVNGHGGHAA